MQAIAAQLEIQYPGSNHGQGAVVQPLSEIIIGHVHPILRTLLGASALLLLIAAINVASLLLVRSESRRREIAVRGALGATSGRITRQFVTEIALLASSGCLGGLLLSICAMSVLRKLIPKTMADQMPFVNHVGLHPHVVLFAAIVAMFSAALMVLTPVFRLSFQQIREGLNDGGRSAAGRFWSRIGSNLVVAELAVAVILLVAAGLLGKSFYRLLHVDLGFNPQHLATLQMAARADLYPKPEQRVALLREVTRRLSALPGVQSVGITSDVPVQCNCDTDWLRIVGKPYHGEHNEVNDRDISPSYLPTLQAKLIRGRFFTEDDDASRSPKIVINEALAKKYFPGEDPIGKKVANGALDPKSMREIIGVVGDVREAGLDDDLWPAEYEAMYHGPDNFVAVAIRTAGDDPTVLPSAIKTIHQIDPNLGTYGEITMTDQINSSQSALLHRFSTWLVGGFACIALILSVVGLYGVIAYSVSQRTREIGVRMALGAQRSNVYSMVMQQAGWLTIAGIGIGLVCAVGASRLMGKLLFGVQSWDVATLAAVAVVLGAASLAASFLPAHRAASVNPNEALRSD
jgi:macrolide transport system ATP-binding/permease protein